MPLSINCFGYTPRLSDEVQEKEEGPKLKQPQQRALMCQHVGDDIHPLGTWCHVNPSALSVQSSQAAEKEEHDARCKLPETSRKQVKGVVGETKCLASLHMLQMFHVLGFRNFFVRPPGTIQAKGTAHRAAGHTFLQIDAHPDGSKS